MSEPDLEYTHCTKCPVCGRMVAAGTECDHRERGGVMLLYHADIPGNPAGWARAGACVRAGHAAIYEKRSGPAYTWKGLLLLHLIKTKPACNINEPVRVEAEFRFQRPKSHFGKRGLLPSAPKHHTGKPDLDNAVKLLLDAMVEARVLEDDRCVVTLSALKEWNTNAPGCTVRVWSV